MVLNGLYYWYHQASTLLHISQASPLHFKQEKAFRPNDEFFNYFIPHKLILPDYQNDSECNELLYKSIYCASIIPNLCNLYFANHIFYLPNRIKLYSFLR